jgi:uncharacterized protein (TIGR02147 family)
MDIFNFKKYREIIRQSLKLKGSKGQIGKLAEAIPMHPTQLSQILSGSKELNLEQAHATCQYFEFSDIEMKYFILLVEKERAGTQGLKKYFDKELDKIRKDSLQISQRLKEHRNLSDQEKSIFYSSWMYSAIRLFCSIGKGATLEEIATYFALERKKCFEVMEYLTSVDLCNLKDHRYYMGTQHTHVAANSPHAIKHHLNWRIKSLQRQENVQEQELVFTAPMSISEKDFEIIREKLTATLKDCIELAKESEAEHLAFLTMDWLKI